MQAAFPGADIDITKRQSSSPGIDTVIAAVEGVRADMPPNGPLRHDLAVECRFDGDVLTGFRWTAGPLH